MKVVSLVLALLMLSSVLVFADCADRYSEYQLKSSNELGLGVDTIVYEFEGMPNDLGLDTIEIQQKWNTTDSRYEGYAVVKCNAYRLVRGFLGIK